MGQPTPRGVYPTLWDFVEWSRVSSMRDHEMQNVMYMEETLNLVPPKGSSRPNHPGFRREAVTIPKAYVAVLPEGRYWVADNKMAAVIAPDNKIVLDVSMQYRKPNEAHPVYKRRELPPASSTKETVALLNFVWDNNYYHWLGDVLGRFHLLEKSGIRIDKYIVTGKGNPGFKRETLALLGVPQRKVVKNVPGMHIQPKRLVVPSLNVYQLDPFVPHPMPGWASEYVRGTLTSRIGGLPASGGGRRIYVSRKYAPVRAVTNEEDVAGLLEDCGFETVYLESVSVPEQIKLFAGADVIVAPHGAGLANLMFCRPGTKVLELFAPNYVNPVYWYLSCRYGLDYYTLIGEGERMPIRSGIGDVEYRTENITVNMEQLFETVYEINTEGLK